MLYLVAKTINVIIGEIFLECARDLVRNSASVYSPWLCIFMRYLTYFLYVCNAVLSTSSPTPPTARTMFTVGCSMTDEH
jgi:hypothetical protein